MKDKKNLKGFTLIELIIVMAIFSIIMFGAIRIMNPLNKIVKNASIQESSSASVDNIKHYVEDSIRYAECIDVYQGKLSKDGGTTEMTRAEAAKNFIDEHYFNRVVPNAAGTGVVPLTGKVRMLEFNNDDDGSGNYGTITEYEWDFKAGQRFTVIDSASYAAGTLTVLDTPNANNASVTNEVSRPAINPNYYDNYSFYFKTGYNEIVDNKVQLVSGYSDNLSPSMFALSVIVRDKKDGKFNPDSDDLGATYRLSNINMSLVNINSGFKSKIAYYYPVYYKNDDVTSATIIDLDNDGVQDYVMSSMASMATLFGGPYKLTDPALADLNNDHIYLIYTLPNEI